jgi:two-component system OmpR family sensor kinase
MKSLRARLVAALLGACAVGLLLLGAITYVEQRSFHLDRLDDQARAAIDPVGRELGDAGIGPSEHQGDSERRGRGGPGPESGLPPGTYAQRRDARGKALGDVVLDPFDQGVTAKPRIPKEVPIDQPFTVDGPDSRYRVLAETSGDDGVTIVAVPMRGVDRTLNRLLVVEGLVIVGVLILLAAVASVIVRIGLRPLDRVSETAGRIAGGDLSHRVESTDPRTETGRLGNSFNSMLDRLEAAFRVRQESEDRLRRFLADASHELRTPLSSIRGYAELYRMGAASDPAGVERSMQRIEEEATRMGVLVEDLLTLARLDEVADAPHRELDLSQLVRDAVDDARVTAPGRPISMAANGPALVRGDAHQLRQVLANLVRNALVHTPADAPLDVSLASSGSRVRVEVRDHGPGLPTDDPSELFERFWRQEGGRERGRSGAGLGLAIVAAIVAAHGGEVTAANAPGGGAVFVVELPAR